MFGLLALLTDLLWFPHLSYNWGVVNDMRQAMTVYIFCTCFVFEMILSFHQMLQNLYN